MGEVLDRIAALVQDHRTTLVFVNTRRLSERLAHELGERLGPDQVSAHHGSLSKQRREKVETRLEGGRAPSARGHGVARARDRHRPGRARLPGGLAAKHRDVPPTRRALEPLAVGDPGGRSVPPDARRAGRVRRAARRGHGRPARRGQSPTRTARHPRPAAHRRGRRRRRVGRDRGFTSSCGAPPLMASSSREDFDSVVELVSEGITTGRGTRMAYLHRDQVNGVLRPRRGARIAAITSGGAIPEVGDYRVVADPDETPVGSVNEDFAIESMVGDVFLLGTHSWRITSRGAGNRARRRRRGSAPDDPVLGGRGAEPDRRALRRGVGSSSGGRPDSRL